MANHWRISSLSGMLLAAYFIPVWSMIAYRIVVSPIQGLFERPNISLALFVSDHLQLAGMATVRFAWLLALGRMTVVAFFAVFLVFISRAAIRKSGGSQEALGMALAIGSVISFASMLLAAQAGEAAALRMHAAELLMMLGTVIVMAVEPPAQQPADVSATSGELSLQQQT
jgi:hypothetical protein